MNILLKNDGNIYSQVKPDRSGEWEYYFKRIQTIQEKKAELRQAIYHLIIQNELWEIYWRSGNSIFEYSIFNR